MIPDLNNSTLISDRIFRHYINLVLSSKKFKKFKLKYSLKLILENPSII